MIWLQMAARNLSRQKFRTFLAIAAIAVSVWLLLVVQSYIESVHTAFLDDLVHGRTGYIQIHKLGYFENRESRPLSFVFEDSVELRQKILSIPMVKAVMPRLTFPAALSVPQVDDSVLQTALLIDGHDVRDAEKVVPILGSSIHSGKMFGGDTANELVLHRSVAEVYNFSYDKPPVDEATLPALIVPGKDGILKARLMIPVGEYRDSFSGGHSVGITSLVAAQQLTGLPDKISAYAVDLVDPAKIMPVKKALEETLGHEFEVKTWIDIVPFMQENFQVENIGAKIGLFIFFLVAAIGSMNTMMMTVMERTREIGTMLALGIERRQLIRLFVIEGSLIGVCGSIIGIASGAIAISLMSSYGVTISSAPDVISIVARPLISYPNLAACFFLGVFGTTLASFLPALRAARKSPIEALGSR